MIRVGVIGSTVPDRFAWHILQTLPLLGVVGVSLGTPASRLTRGPVRVRNAVAKFADAPSAVDFAAKKLARGALAEEVDLVLTLNDNLTPGAVRILRDSGVEVALWHPDHVANWGRMWFAIADYSRLFFTDPVAVQRLRDVQGLPAVYLPEACNPRVHRPMGPGSGSGTLVLAGNTYTTRVRLLDRLHADGVPLELYGATPSRWVPDRPVWRMHKRESIVLDEKAHRFRGAGAVLNNLHPAENGVNARLFEATGCGAAVLTEWRPALADLFEEGREVVTFRTYDELLSRARWLLTDREAAAAIGDRATVRCHEEHTYTNRLRRLVESVL